MEESFSSLACAVLLPARQPPFWRIACCASPGLHSCTIAATTTHNLRCSPCRRMPLHHTAVPHRCVCRRSKVQCWPMKCCRSPQRLLLPRPQTHTLTPPPQELSSPSSHPPAPCRHVPVLHERVQVVARDVGLRNCTAGQEHELVAIGHHVVEELRDTCDAGHTAQGKGIVSVRDR